MGALLFAAPELAMIGEFGSVSLIAKEIELLEAGQIAIKTVVEVEKAAVALEKGIQYTKSSLKLGQEMHKAYKAGLADGVTTFKEFTGIKGMRPDFVDFATKTIYELKPFNPRQIQSGIQQLNKYKAAFEAEYEGTVWKTILDTY